MPLDDLYNKITVLGEFDWAANTADIITENAESITELVINQLKEGISGDGSQTRAKTGIGYSLITISKKDKNDGLASTVEYVTMYETGEFYFSLKVVTDGMTFEVTSDVPQFSELDGWNKGHLIELTNENCEIFKNEILLPQLIERFQLAFNGI
jgi:hypothetical protein